MNEWNGRDYYIVVNNRTFNDEDAHVMFIYLENSKPAKNALKTLISPNKMKVE